MKILSRCCIAMIIAGILLGQIVTAQTPVGRSLTYDTNSVFTSTNTFLMATQDLRRASAGSHSNSLVRNAEFSASTNRTAELESRTNQWNAGLTNGTGKSGINVVQSNNQFFVQIETTSALWNLLTNNASALTNGNATTFFGSGRVPYGYMPIGALTNLLTTMPWATISQDVTGAYTVGTNTTKIAIATFTDNNLAGGTNASATTIFNSGRVPYGYMPIGAITNLLTTMPWATISQSATGTYSVDTNATKLAIATFTDNNASSLTNFPAALTNGFVTISVSTNGVNNWTQLQRFVSNTHHVATAYFNTNGTFDAANQAYWSGIAVAGLSGGGWMLFTGGAASRTDGYYIGDPDSVVNGYNGSMTLADGVISINSVWAGVGDVRLNAQRNVLFGGAQVRGDIPGWWTNVFLFTGPVSVSNDMVATGKITMAGSTASYVSNSGSIYLANGAGINVNTNIPMAVGSPAFAAASTGGTYAVDIILNTRNGTGGTASPRIFLYSGSATGEPSTTYGDTFVNYICGIANDGNHVWRLATGNGDVPTSTTGIAYNYNGYVGIGGEFIAGIGSTLRGNTIVTGNQTNWSHLIVNSNVNVLATGNYQYAGVTGFSGTITNAGPPGATSTQYIYYASGIVTNQLHVGP